MGYPKDGRVGLNIDAFDRQNTTIADNPVLKRLDGDKWNVINPIKVSSSAKIPISEMTGYIDLNNYPYVAEGDYKRSSMFFT